MKKMKKGFTFIEIILSIIFLSILGIIVMNISYILVYDKELYYISEVKAEVLNKIEYTKYDCKNSLPTTTNDMNEWKKDLINEPVLKNLNLDFNLNCIKRDDNFFEVIIETNYNNRNIIENSFFYVDTNII